MDRLILSFHPRTLCDPAPKPPKPDLSSLSYKLPRTQQYPFYLPELSEGQEEL